ncbi:MAG TPA: phytoene/squalene synthase family protein [Rhodospirillaceae bacterium]|nr:phytoene/squalene synthase family protein [Rhodospirillaceae bacterium]
MPARWLNRPLAGPADHAVCRRSIRGGSKTFSAASLFLPKRLRDAAFPLYAFCRLSDDMVDEEGGSTAAVAHLRERLDRVYRGQPANAAVDRAFADVVARYGLPRALPEALIDGLEWDVAGVRCETLSDLYAYATRVAGTVGAMMAVLMGCHDPEAVARACDLGIAMQLTNVARDVGEDARNGRLYLPRSWLWSEGVDPDAWLARPDWTPAIGAAVERLLAAADELYRRADSGIGGLPASCRASIFAARHMYREIGEEVARRRFDSVSGRARVSGRRKLKLAGKAVSDALFVRQAKHALPPLDEAAYLVEAVASARPSILALSLDQPGRIASRILWVAELMVALEMREQVSG